MVGLSLFLVIMGTLCVVAAVVVAIQANGFDKLPGLIFLIFGVVLLCCGYKNIDGTTGRQVVIAQRHFEKVANDFRADGWVDVLDMPELHLKVVSKNGTELMIHRGTFVPEVTLFNRLPSEKKPKTPDTID